MELQRDTEAARATVASAEIAAVAGGSKKSGSKK